ncbi:MAG: hypothetical protein ACFCD0_19550, partial [Gemmataceae bacterium]
MSDFKNPFDSLSTNDLALVDDCCLRFEKEWRDGQQPRLEDHLTEMKSIQFEDPQAARQALLWGLVRIEVEYRRQFGETPSPEEYIERFPEWQKLLSDLGNTWFPESETSTPFRGSFFCKRFVRPKLWRLSGASMVQIESFVLLEKEVAMSTPKPLRQWTAQL